MDLQDINILNNIFNNNDNIEEEEKINTFSNIINNENINKSIKMLNDTVINFENIIDSNNSIENIVDNRIDTIEDLENNTIENITNNSIENITNNSIENITNNSIENITNNSIENIVENTIENISNSIENITNNSIENITNNSIENIVDNRIDTIENITNNTIENIVDNRIDTIENITNNSIEKIVDNRIDTIENIPENKVRFNDINFNQFKTIDRFSKSLNLSSINSETESEFSYTQNIKSPVNNYDHKPIKHIRATKSQKKFDGIDEVDYIYNKLQDFIRYMNINRTNYGIVICKSIEIIENYKDMKTNNNKKDIVTRALNRLISIDLELCEYDKKLFINTINNIIDLFVNCTKINTLTDKNENHKNIDEIILAKSGQIVHSLIDKLTTIVVKKHYCIEKLLVNIVTLTNIVMILVDKYVYLSGVEKKIIVIQTMNNFIKERLKFIMDIDESKIDELTLSLDSIPLSIDLIISLKKGKYKINTKDEVYTHKVKKNIFGIVKKKKIKENILTNYDY
jgi:hypothetical protein